MRGNACGLLAILASFGCTNAASPADKRGSEKRLAICKDFLNKHDLDGADVECGKAIALDKANDEAFIVRGLVSFRRALDSQGTMEIEGCLTGVDAEATHKDLEAFLEKADQDFESATKVNPENGWAWESRGVVHTLLEDYPSAQSYLAKALDKPMAIPNPALTRANLGWVMFHQKNYVEAAKELRQAKQFEPKMCVATYRLARVYFAREEWEKAAEQFQTVSDDPSCGSVSQEASYYLMKTSIQQGLVDEAKRARDACLKTFTKSCMAAQCRADGGKL